MTAKSKYSIVIVTNQFKNIKSGVGTLANVIINELKSDYDILVICPNAEKTLEQTANLHIKTVRTSKFDPTSHKWLSFSKQVAKITNKLDHSKYKIIIFLDAREGYFTKNNIPTLGLIHDFYSDRFGKLTMENIKTYPDWVKRLVYFKTIKILEIRAYRRLQWLVTDSEFAKNELIKNYDSSLKIDVIRNGIDLTKFKKASKQKEKNTVLFVGGNFYRKGLPELLHAVEKVSQPQPIKCYVIGKDKNSKRLEKITQNVEFLGQLNYEQTLEYYNKCQVFCMPSHFENYAMVYLEALYFNMQVIASVNSGTVEIKKHFQNLYIVDPKNIDSIANTLKEALNKPLKIRTKNLDIISSSKMGQQYKELIKKIIS